MERRLRVAVVSYDFAGPCVAHASAIAPLVDVRLWLPAPDVAPHADRLDAAVELTKFTRPRLRQPLRQLATGRRLVRAIRAWRPDVVHVEQGHLWFNLLLPRLRPLPLVVGVHDAVPHRGDRPSTRTPQPLRAIAFRAADRVLVRSRAVRDRLVRDLGLDPADVSVVPLLEANALYEQREPTTPTVLFFGRIWPYKGLRHLVDAEPAISAAVPDVRFVIAGTGEDLAPYRARMTHPDRFEVVDEDVSEARKHDLLDAASVVVLPYVDATQSGVVPLAYAHATPVVATTVGGLSEMVDDEQTGLLVPPADPSALAAAVVRLLRDDEGRRRLGRAGQRKLETEWSPATVGPQIVKAYEDVVAARAEGATA